MAHLVRPDGLVQDSVCRYVSEPYDLTTSVRDVVWACVRSQVINSMVSDHLDSIGVQSQLSRSSMVDSARPNMVLASQ